MEIVADILKITIPALLVFLTTWLILRNMIKNDRNKRRHELLLQSNKTITPIRLQAYERIVLFLERISLESLIIRVSTPEMTVNQLYTALLNAIRSEFEHNLSQQIYMSSQAWEVVKSAKTNMIKIINNEADNLSPNSAGMNLTKCLFDKVVELEKEPTHVAIDFLKIEISTFLAY